MIKKMDYCQLSFNEFLDCIGIKVDQSQKVSIELFEQNKINSILNKKENIQNEFFTDRVVPDDHKKPHFGIMNNE